MLIMKYHFGQKSWVKQQIQTVLVLIHLFFVQKTICMYYFASIKHICGSTFKEIQVFDGYDESLGDFSTQ